MSKAFGIINFAGNHIRVDGLQSFRPVGAFSFLGRYRTIDFPISNMSNSGIDYIQVYVRQKPRSLTEHLGTGRHYNINSKRGNLQILYAEHNQIGDVYSTDIAAYMENMDCIEDIAFPYVVIAPSYMIYTADYSEFLKDHIESGADITMMYHSVDNAKEAFLNCNTLNINKQKGVLSIEPNHGNAKNRNIFMDTYVMSKELFIDLVKKAHKMSSMYTFFDIINEECTELDIRAMSHRGYFAAIADFNSYYQANMDLIDLKHASDLFDDKWPIYTRTNDSCPTQYFEGSKVTSSVISNGCLIEGTVENSILGRGCTIKPGAVVRNCVVSADVTIGRGVHAENLVIDKHARLVRGKRVIAAPEKPGYIKRGDAL
ncbi:glucose-1-phosphate adenylyltransferase subunit GlgD [Ruminococcus sp. CLA-AA-H200]|uniref:Glucose-1-phosphate adenylyltransferase subunit GlgD n=1 Tax=Ruminococcus turbiniformis TaxID=2881258 RepID=A0ABS8FYJ4_9FIRM|nr:glucose-1-phosphate adenylyltransferase subunit GlgD [Ruminococcus turbiniformis]MCC2254664.1 glucose-1-phosphate adenylyltransferase subunit GlgD [Ruminococcus turbiniformis]